MRAVIAEDAVLLREGLTRLLREGGFDVVESVDNPEGLLRAVERHRPDICVIDVRMPPTFNDEGVRAALVIRRQWPEVNLLITTTIKQYNLSLTIVGPIDKLRTSYVSDPALPPVDVINLIARGQTTEETTPTSLGANSILAQGLASQVSSQIGKLAGISSLTIDPLIGGDNRNPSARIAIQQRVTKNFIFTFSTDITSAQREVIQGEYQLNRRWSVSATRDENGGVAFDAKFHKVF